MKANKIVFYFIAVILLSSLCFGLKSCSETNRMTDVTVTTEYKVHGFSETPPAYKRSAHRYVFVNDNKYGDFTFEVSPRTYYDVSHGKDKVTFTMYFHELYTHADNQKTKNNLMKYVEDDFGISKYVAKNYALMEILSVIAFFASLIIGLSYSGYWIDRSETFETICSFTLVLCSIVAIILSFMV